MYDDVKVLIAARDAANGKYAAARRAASGQHAIGTADCPGCVANQKAYAECFAVLEAAWEPLKGSADPLVRWIAENCDIAHRSDAALILEALPASMETLDGIAEDQNWCAEYTALRSRAERAGVLPAAAGTAVPA